MKNGEIEIPVSTGIEKYDTGSVYSQFRKPYFEIQTARVQIGLPEQNIAEYIADQIKANGFRARRAELDAMFNSGC